MHNYLEENLEFFKKKVPNIYSKFVDYKPKYYNLVADPITGINLEYNGRPVYPESPDIFNKRLVDEFSIKPRYNKIDSMPRYVPGGEDDVHIKTMNQLLEAISPLKDLQAKQSLQAVTNLMFMFGIGTGQQISYLNDKTTIRNLVIFEPEDDIFYASLQTLNWVEVFASAEKENRTVALFVGLSVQAAYDALIGFLRDRGLHNSAKVYVYKTLNSDKIDALLNTINDRMPMIMRSVGYYDDERISLAHTHQNLKNKMPILASHALAENRYFSVPVFLVGNGPSLDAAEDFLRDNQHKGIIISSGTAIGSLAAMGIKPDFHVEIERNYPVFEWLNSSTTKEYRKGITMLGLNTVHPDVFSLFDTAGMALKTNDLGLQYVSTMIRGEEYLVNLANSNPTVVNGAMAFAVAMGALEIYTFGTDFGLPDNKTHHSKHSIHYKVKDVEGLDFYKAEGHPVQGNFKEKVLTNHTLTGARINVELLLEMFPYVRVYNTADGAYIKGTKAITYNNIILKDIPNKDKAVDSIFKLNFSKKEIVYPKKSETVKDKLYDMPKILDNLEEVLKTDLTDYNSCVDLLDRMHMTLRSYGVSSKNSALSYTLIKGTVHSFNMVMMSILNLTPNVDRNVEYFIKFKPFFQQVIVDLRNNYNSDEFSALDYRKLNITQRLEGNNNEQVPATIGSNQEARL